jgi:hypothetical protein
MTKNFYKDIEVVVDGDDICDWVSDNYDPDDVFAEWKLKEWAERMGYKDPNEVDALYDLIKDLDGEITELKTLINRMEQDL